jgi:hypothetical protein
LVVGPLLAGLAVAGLAAAGAGRLTTLLSGAVWMSLEPNVTAGFFPFGDGVGLLSAKAGAQRTIPEIKVITALNIGAKSSISVRQMNVFMQMIKHDLLC